MAVFEIIYLNTIWEVGKASRLKFSLIRIAALMCQV